MIEKKQQFARVGAKSVLLLGDDGRMGKLLRAHFGAVRLEEEKNVLHGLLRVSRGGFDLVLLNAEAPRQKAAEAMRALKQVGGQTPVVLYGEAWSEIYAQPALAEGAADFLVWPIPLAELRQLVQGGAGPNLRTGLNPPQPEQPRISLPAVNQEILHQYQALAGLIPEGQQRLIGAAEELLPEILRVEWVKIVPGEVLGGSFPLESGKNVHRQIALTGPQGVVGEMLLGPPRNQDNGAGQFTQETAGYLGTLLNLAWRDEHLKRLATVDELTGAYNRRYFEHFTRQVIEQSKDEKTEVTLLVFDIDEFKHYNDTYGHIAGDVILKEATRLMRKCCREHDVVARIGGDEFAVLFWAARPGDQEIPPGVIHRRRRADQTEETPCQRKQRTHPEVVVFLSNRFRRMMRTSEFSILGSEARGVLTISGGLASFPWDGHTVEELLLKADDALLLAKRSGKNRIYLVGQPAANES